MQLKNITAPYRDILIVFVDRVKHIPIPHDFLLITVFRCRLVRIKLLKPDIRSPNAFDLIRGFGALDFRQFYQSFKLQRPLIQKLLLPALIFMNLGNKP